MNVEIAIDLVHQLILTALICIGPFLCLTILIGIVVSLAQTITSIQDQTLAFVPKLLGNILLIWLLSNWLFRHLVEFSTLIIERAGELAKWFSPLKQFIYGFSSSVAVQPYCIIFLLVQLTTSPHRLKSDSAQDLVTFYSPLSAKLPSCYRRDTRCFSFTLAKKPL